MAPHSSAPVKAARPPPVRQPGSGDPVPMAGGAPVPPPYPTESTMRMGLLFAMQGSMSGMGETGKVGEGKRFAHLSKAYTDESSRQCTRPAGATTGAAAGSAATYRRARGAGSTVRPRSCLRYRPGLRFGGRVAGGHRCCRPHTAQTADRTKMKCIVITT